MNEPYFHEERFWRCLAANHTDDNGNDYFTDEDREAINGVEREEEWRFHEQEDAIEFAESIGAEPPTRIADGPHRCNGWVVRVREPVPA